MTTKKLKIWKVFLEDHEVAGQIRSHDQIQAEVFHDLIVEPDIQRIITQNLSLARTALELGNKTGNRAPTKQGADIAIRTLMEIRNILCTRNLQKVRMITFDDEEMQETLKKFEAVCKLYNENKADQKELLKGQLVMLNYLEKLMGEPFTQ